MSARVDFYIMAEADDDSRLRTTCRIVDKAYQKGNKVFIHTDEQTTVQQLDDLLWTFRAGSFIPHAPYTIECDKTMPVYIGNQQTPDEFDDVLINLASEVPDFYSQFQRIIEIVPSDGPWQSISRAHYKLYQQHNCQLNSHKL